MRRNQTCQHETEAAVEKAVAAYLRRASDREGGREKRRQRPDQNPKCAGNILGKRRLAVRNSIVSEDGESE